MPLVPFARKSVPGGASTVYSGERAVNLFLRASGNDAYPFVLLGRGGLVEYADTGTGSAVRAIGVMGGTTYAISGGAVWKVYQGSAANVGTVADGQTSLAASENELAIVAGGKYYICNGTTTTEYTPGSLTSAVGVEYVDGYFVVIGEADGRKDALQISALDDGKTFDALEYAFAEENPDALVGIIRDHGEVYLFGTSTVQPFYNSGDANFPFAPNQSAMMEQGCISGATIAKVDNGVYWVRPDGAVVRTFGSSPEVVSSPEVKDELAKSAVTGGLAFSERGAEFYAVTRETGTALVYDITTGLWHERTSDLDDGPWQARTCTEMNGAFYFGCLNGKIGTLDSETYTEFGDVLPAEAVSVPMDRAGGRFRINKMHVNVSGGGMLNRVPQIMLQISEDGVTWGPEKWRSLGAQGEYWRRTVWHALGTRRRAQARLRITDPVPRDIHGVSYE